MGCLHFYGLDLEEREVEYAEERAMIAEASL